MKTAHYFKSGKKAIVIISTTAQPIGQEHTVSGVREARKVAKAENATCWNF